MVLENCRRGLRKVLKSSWISYSNYSVPHCRYYCRVRLCALNTDHFWFHLPQCVFFYFLDVFVVFFPFNRFVYLDSELFTWQSFVYSIYARGIRTFRSPVFSLLWAQVPSGNFRSEERKYRGAKSPCTYTHETRPDRCKLAVLVCIEYLWLTLTRNKLDLTSVLKLCRKYGGFMKDGRAIYCSVVPTKQQTTQCISVATGYKHCTLRLWLQLRFDFCSTAVRLRYDLSTTVY